MTFKRLYLLNGASYQILHETHIVNKNISKVKSGIIISDISDHFGIFACIKTKLKYNTFSKYKTMRCFNEANITNFKNMISQTDFSPVSNSSSSESAYDTFISLYTDKFNQAFPLKTLRMVLKYTKRSPWISSGILKSSLTKAKLLKKKLKHPTTRNIDTYKSYSCIYNVLRIAKSTYYSRKLLEHKFDMKRTWSLLKTAIDKKNVRILFPTILLNMQKLLSQTNMIYLINSIVFLPTLEMNLATKYHYQIIITLNILAIKTI